MENFVYIDNKIRDQRIAKLKKDYSNTVISLSLGVISQRCFDCDAKDPQWISASFGLFLCIQCSGKHRGYGPHISFVRSCTLDAWQESEMLQMELGGNTRARAFLKKSNLQKFEYSNPTAAKYKQQLEKSVILIRSSSCVRFNKYSKNKTKKKISIRSAIKMKLKLLATQKKNTPKKLLQLKKCCQKKPKVKQKPKLQLELIRRI